MKEILKKRLGTGISGSNNDFNELKSHPFFEGVNIYLNFIKINLKRRIAYLQKLKKLNLIAM